MHTTFLSHDLTQEFPILAPRVDRLQATNGRFARLYAQHASIDRDIQEAERRRMLDDFSLEAMKKKRLRLKDDLYQMAVGAS